MRQTLVVRLLQLEILWRRFCCWASWASDDLLRILQEAFWFGWGDDMYFGFSLALLGYLMGFRVFLKEQSLLFFSSSSSFSFSSFIELHVLLYLISNFLTVVTLNLAVWDFELKVGWRNWPLFCQCALLESARMSSSRLGWCFKSAPCNQSRLAFLCTL